MNDRESVAAEVKDEGALWALGEFGRSIADVLFDQLANDESLPIGKRIEKLLGEMPEYFTYYCASSQEDIHQKIKSIIEGESSPEAGFYKAMEYLNGVMNACKMGLIKPPC